MGVGTAVLTTRDGRGDSCVVKRSGLAAGVAIPVLTLAQAGHAVMCRSDCWTSKMVTSAWCVPMPLPGLRTRECTAQCKLCYLGARLTANV